MSGHMRFFVCAFVLSVSVVAPAQAASSPGWFLQGPIAPDEVAFIQNYLKSVNARQPNPPGCTDDIAKLCPGLAVPGTRHCLEASAMKLSGMCRESMAATPSPEIRGAPLCAGSPICDPPGARGDRSKLMRVEWKQTMGYTFAYPYDIPAGGTGIQAVGIDSKDNLWAFQRSDAGMPALYKFGPDRRRILSIGDDVIGHQLKAHGLTIDAADNVWITDANGATVMKLSPEGKLLFTLGTAKRPGDWDESRGQHLLWQPLDVAFAPDGDFFVAEGHAHESPNDADSADAANNIGASRILHFDRNAKFINQWFGNNVGQGKFSGAHGIAVDPKTGDVWIGDREQYRLVVYRPDGTFVKTLQMRNLTCAVAFDPAGQLWISTGMEGQVLKVDKKDGKILGAIGNGPGLGEGQFVESNFMAWDRRGNLYTGDTLRSRITEMVRSDKGGNH